MDIVIIIGIIVYLVYRQYKKKKIQRTQQEERESQRLQLQREQDAQKKEMQQRYLSYNEEYIIAARDFAYKRYREMLDIVHYELLPTKDFDSLIFVAYSYTDISCYTEKSPNGSVKWEKRVCECIFKDHNCPYENEEELAEHILPFSSSDLLNPYTGCDIEELRHTRISSDYNGYEYWETLPIDGYLILPYTLAERKEIIKHLLSLETPW